MTLETCLSSSSQRITSVCFLLLFFFIDSVKLFRLLLSKQVQYIISNLKKLNNKMQYEHIIYTLCWYNMYIISSQLCKPYHYDNERHCVSFFCMTLPLFETVSNLPKYHVCLNTCQQISVINQTFQHLLAKNQQWRCFVR